MCVRVYAGVCVHVCVFICVYAQSRMANPEVQQQLAAVREEGEKRLADVRESHLKDIQLLQEDNLLLKLAKKEAEEVANKKLGELQVRWPYPLCVFPPLVRL